MESNEAARQVFSLDSALSMLAFFRQKLRNAEPWGPKDIRLLELLLWQAPVFRSNVLAALMANDPPRFEAEQRLHVVLPQFGAQLGERILTQLAPDHRDKFDTCGNIFRRRAIPGVKPARPA